MRKILAALSALVLLLAPVVHAAQVVDGKTPANGKPAAAEAVGGWDGATQRVLKTDSNGILRATEEYPITSQKVSFTAATLIPVHTGIKAIGNGYLTAPYGQRLLHVQSARAGSTSSPMYLYFYSSDDNVTYKPLLCAMGTAGAAGVDFLGALQDTAKTDTVMIALPMQTTGTSVDAYYAIPPSLPLGYYTQIWARRDSSTSTVSTATLTLTWLLREQ